MKNDEVKVWIKLAQALVGVYFGSYILAGGILAGVAAVFLRVLKSWRHNQ